MKKVFISFTVAVYGHCELAADIPHSKRLRLGTGGTRETHFATDVKYYKLSL